MYQCGCTGYVFWLVYSIKISKRILRKIRCVECTANDLADEHSKEYYYGVAVSVSHCRTSNQKIIQKCIPGR